MKLAYTTTSIPPGFKLFLFFSIGLAVEFSSCFIPVLNFDLYVAVLIH